MAQIGNHLKMHLPSALRARARTFYGEILGCKQLESPAAGHLEKKSRTAMTLFDPKSRVYR